MYPFIFRQTKKMAKSKKFEFYPRAVSKLGKHYGTPHYGAKKIYGQKFYDHRNFSGS
jgi:hypothetical protein